MNDMSQRMDSDMPDTPGMSSRDWMRVLAKYRQPSRARSLFELAITVIPLAGFVAAAWWAMSVSYLLALALTVPASAFLLRLFLIQHDCGHGAFFSARSANDWVGRALGVLTMTPYDVWKRCHAIHHASSGNLDTRGIGDIDTLTVREFQALSPWKRFLYRAYRHPVTLFVIGPIYVFVFKQRLPFGVMRDGSRYWISAMATNLGIAVIVAAIIYFVGLAPFLLIYLPTTILAAALGVWLFYVQHQFEDTYWEYAKKWQLHDAALYGSSHYDLPGVLRWLSANIGIHHVHHLYARIPFYRLTQVMRDHPALRDVRRLTLMESFACVKLQLWDENQRRLVTYAEARAC